MWTPEHRRAANRDGLRYPSDLTAEEWAVVAPMIPPARHGGRKRSVNVREVLKDRVPMEGASQGFAAEEHGARLSRTLELGRHAGTHPSRTVRRGARAGRTRSQPDGSNHRLADRKGRPKRGSWLDPSGYDAGKKIKGRKRHILVDTLGLLLNVVVHPADVQDRDGCFHLLRRARRLFPFIERIFADGGYAGRRMAMTVWRTGAWRLQIVKRSDAAGFEVLPKRWIVERTFAWISRNRRLARDFERYVTTVVAFVRLAMIRIMLRRLATNTSS
jgi:transposase